MIIFTWRSSCFSALSSYIYISNSPRSDVGTPTASTSHDIFASQPEIISVCMPSQRIFEDIPQTDEATTAEPRTSQVRRGREGRPVLSKSRAGLRSALPPSLCVFQPAMCRFWCFSPPPPRCRVGDVFDVCDSGAPSPTIRHVHAPSVCRPRRGQRY